MYTICLTILNSLGRIRIRSFLSRGSEWEHFHPDPEHLHPDPEHLHPDPEHLQPYQEHLHPDPEPQFELNNKDKYFK